MIASKPQAVSYIRKAFFSGPEDVYEGSYKELRKKEPTGHSGSRQTLNPKPPSQNPKPWTLLGGSWDLVSKVISTLSEVISIVTLIIALWWKPKSWNVQTQISCTVFGGDFDPFQVSKIPSFLNSNFGVHSNFGFRFKLGIYVQWKAQEREHNAKFEKFCEESSQ